MTLNLYAPEGATAFTDLTDAASVDMASLNQPLMSALAEKAEAYVVGAVSFGAGSGLLNEAIDCVDSRYVAVSLWYLPNNILSTAFLAVDAAGDYATYIGPATNGGFELDFGSAGGAETCDTNLIGGFAPGVVRWHHLLAAVDTLHPAGEKVMVVYLDDVLLEFTPDDTHSAFISAIAGRTLHFCDDGTGFGDGTYRDFADVWWAVGQNLLVDGGIPEETRRKFISAQGRPVDLGANGEIPTGLAPTVFFHAAPADEAATFQVNRGTGGSFALVGTAMLSPSSSRPGDKEFFISPMHGAGELIVGGNGGVAERLANPGAGTFNLQSINGVLTWTAP